MSKSLEAYKFNVDRLYKSGRVFMWSFTFREVTCTDEAAEKWNRLCTRLRELNLYGLRVLELHETHGVHYHAYIPRWFPVRVMRRIASRCGFGRIHVCKLAGERRYYTSKHFIKQERVRCLRRKRLWACFGDWPTKTRVRDIEVVDRRHELYRGLVATRAAFGDTMTRTVRRQLWVESRIAEIKEIIQGKFSGLGIVSRCGESNLVYS